MARSPNRITPTAGWWASALEEWRTAQLDPKPFAPVVAALARVEALKAETATAKADATATQRAARLAVARGERTYAEVGPELAEAAATLELASVAVLMMKTVAGDATATMTALGDTLIEKYAAPAHEAVIAEVVDLAPAVEGLTSDVEAMRSEGPARDAWSRLIVLASRRRDLLGVARRLRASEIVTVSPGATEAEYGWRHSELLPRGTALSPVRHLLDGIAAGAEPAVLTGVQVTEIDEAREVSLHTPRRPTPIVTPHGALRGGSPIVA